MEKKFFMILGRSGCGKGTQAELLKKALEKQGIEKVLNISTGSSLRAFAATESYTASLTKKCLDTAGLIPEFLIIWVWSSLFIDIMTGKETIILDGAPRRIAEVEPLYSAIKFFGYPKPTVIYLDVSESWAMEKLVSRGRDDDKTIEAQREKMEWFERDVLPCLASYKDDPRYSYLHINGQQTVDEVHAEIMSKLSV